MFEVYMDESGTHDGSPAVVVASYLGRPETWREWSEKWTRAIHPIEGYHAVDAQNLTNEFKGWTADEVGSLAKAILPIIAASKIAAVVVGMDMKAFDVALQGKPELRALFGSPYVACFQWAVQIILNLARQSGNTERIAFIHENNEFQAHAYEAFSWVEANRRGGNDISLTFVSKKEAPALQAADILAYEANKRLRNKSAPARRPWIALRANTFAAHYGEENMEQLVSTLEKIKTGEIEGIDAGLGWNHSWSRGAESK